MAAKRNAGRARKKKATSGVGGLAITLAVLRLLESRSLLRIAGARFPGTVAVNAAVGVAPPQPTEDGFRLAFRVKVEANGRSPENEESRMEIICEYEVQYQVPREPTQDELKHASWTAANIAWPYLREFVASTSSRMGCPSFTLPLLRIDAQSGPELVQL